VFAAVVRKVGAVVVVIGFVVVAGVGPSAGHADLVAATPAPCDVAAEVTTIDIRFDEPLVADSSEMTLADAGGAVVASGGPVTDTFFQGTMSIALAEALPTGDYQVTWSNASARDGDTDQGRFGFTVGPTGTVAAPDCALFTGELAQVGGINGGEGSDGGDDAGGGLPLAVILAGAAVVIAAVVAFTLVRRKGATGPA
jgi:methionine-rich copper-binding protein CopC